MRSSVITRNFQALEPLARQSFFMPLLFVIQFFTWVGMFIVWLFTLPLIVSLEHQPMEQAFAPVRWLGFCFALYVTLSALINLGLPNLAERIGKARLHALSLIIGAVGLGLVSIITTRAQLLGCFCLIAIGWASISSMPYTLVTDRVTDGRYARAMGIFNFASVIPQVAVALSMGALIGSVSPASAFAWGGASMGIAASLTLFLAQTDQRLPPRIAIPN